MGKMREYSLPNRTIKIEKDIPMPISGYLNWKKLADEMNIGDSVFVLSDAEKINLRHAGGRTKKRFVSRRERDGFRVWRSE